jgi:hypothetical protein
VPADVMVLAHGAIDDMPLSVHDDWVRGDPYWWKYICQLYDMVDAIDKVAPDADLTLSNYYSIIKESHGASARIPRNDTVFRWLRAHFSTANAGYDRAALSLRKGAFKSVFPT